MALVLWRRLAGLPGKGNPFCVLLPAMGARAMLWLFRRHGYAVAPAGQGIVGDAVAAEAKQGERTTGM